MRCDFRHYIPGTSEKTVQRIKLLPSSRPRMLTLLWESEDPLVCSSQPPTT